jgi:flagellar FliJ protein
MKGFIFRYQKILKKREDEEEDVKTRLGKANYELQQLLTQKSALLKSQSDFLGSVEAQLSQGVKTAQLRMFEHSKLHMKDKLDGLESKIVEKQLQIMQIKKELTEAVKQRKIMEKLKEKEHEAYIEAFNAAESKVIEEIVNYRSSKKSGDA